MNDRGAASDHVTGTAEIVAAYLAHQEVPPDAVPGLISIVYAALSNLDAPSASAVVKASPAAVRRSITPDALVSFIDGNAYKLLRRHLARHGLTPDAYRARYGLPHDYPMAAASYVRSRSQQAHAQGFGPVRRRKPRGNGRTRTDREDAMR